MFYARSSFIHWISDIVFISLFVLFPFVIVIYQFLCIIGSYISQVFIFFVSLIKLLIISTEPFSRLLYIYILNINSRWFVILKIHLSVSTRKPKMAVCGVNSGRFKSVEKNVLSWLHSWLTRTHSQNKFATVSSFEGQMEHRGESIFPKIYSFLFRYSMLWSILSWKLRW